MSEILFSNLPAHFNSNCRILYTILQHLGYMFDWFYQPFLVRRSSSSRSGWTCERSPCTRRRRSTGAWRRARRARRKMTRRSGSSATTEVEVGMDGWMDGWNLMESNLFFFSHLSLIEWRGLFWSLFDLTLDHEIYMEAYGIWNHQCWGCHWDLGSWKIDRLSLLKFLGYVA